MQYRLLFQHRVCLCYLQLKITKIIFKTMLSSKQTEPPCNGKIAPPDFEDNKLIQTAVVEQLLFIAFPVFLFGRRVVNSFLVIYSLQRMNYGVAIRVGIDSCRIDAAVAEEIFDIGYGDPIFVHRHRDAVTKHVGMQVFWKSRIGFIGDIPILL